MYLDKVKAKEEMLHRAGAMQFVPCTENEVLLLEQWFGHALPQAYREFLLWMGHWGGGLLMGSECFYDDLRVIQDWAKDLLKEDGFPGAFPKDAFIFWMHQGYQFSFFSCHEGEDPPVYYYLEEQPVKSSFSQSFPHFSDFLMQAVDAHIAFLSSQVVRRAEVAKTDPKRAQVMEEEERRRKETIEEIGKRHLRWS